MEEKLKKKQKSTVLGSHRKVGFITLPWTSLNVLLPCSWLGIGVLLKGRGTLHGRGGPVYWLSRESFKIALETKKDSRIFVQFEFCIHSLLIFVPFKRIQKGQRRSMQPPVPSAFQRKPKSFQAKDNISSTSHNNSKGEPWLGAQGSLQYKVS